jgi:hypothetical protein
MRKIVQISVMPESFFIKGEIYALCDDGTLWSRVDRNNAEWVQKSTPPTADTVEGANLQ